METIEADLDLAGENLRLGELRRRLSKEIGNSKKIIKVGDTSPTYR
jgi:hypothetical protein